MPLLEAAFTPTAALVVIAPFDNGDNSDFGNVFLVPLYGNMGALNILNSLAEEGTDAVITPSRGSCPTEPPTGRYNAAPTADGGYAMTSFMPPMTNALGKAFAQLNSKGIIPTVNSGFRTAADQKRMINGGSGGNPAAAGSWHQVGMAVDIRPHDSRIVDAMTAQGFTWGGNFNRVDPPHFQFVPSNTSPSPALVKACSGGNAP